MSFAVAGRQPMPQQPLSGAHEARERNALSGRQPFSRHSLHGAAELRSNTPFPGGGFRRLRAAGTVSKRIDTPYGGFYPLGTPSSALLGIPRSTERLHRSYLCSGPKKGTAVPLPARRPQSAIPFTAALKPLEFCDSIYAKPVQSAATTPRQCGKREPIPFLYASYL